MHSLVILLLLVAGFAFVADVLSPLTPTPTAEARFWPIVFVVFFAFHLSEPLLMPAFEDESPIEGLPPERTHCKLNILFCTILQ